MYFQTAFSTLCRQNLETYLFTSANILKQNPLYKLQPMIVQVISNECISDGITNFQCKSTRGPLKKGSFIRLIEWRLELNNFLIVVEHHQYLGGQGYQVRNGKPWDIQKLKLVIGSHFVSNDFVVLHAPPSGVQNRAKNGPVGTFKLKAAEERYYFPIFSLHPGRKNQRGLERKTNKQKDSKVIKNIQQKQKDKSEIKQEHQGMSDQQKEKCANIQEKDCEGKNKSFDKQLKQAHAILSQKIKAYNQEEDTNCKNTELAKNEDINNRNYVFSKLDVQKAKKMRAPKNETIEEPMSQNAFISFQNETNVQSKLQNLDFNCKIEKQIAIKLEVKSQPVGQSMDSNGRKVIFNKQEIHKLLGGE